ncbi:MAG: hypothetical protein EDQ89_09510 [Acidobacteria bacterium]|nr:MAG: hypothetical protein EDQ89_09510 [Acidobacteriota bacterium]MCL4286772.1 hypothetical protein [Thermoleophilia bacterium]GIK78264.1 MAG: hypothetical protein BroJett022_19540 [Actinomycetes bacterium]
MSAGAAAALAIICLALAAVAYGPDLVRRLRRRERREPRRPVGWAVPDPGEELRAERRAERLLGQVVGADALEAYRALGFLHLFGGEGHAYGYLIYPHKPIVSFDATTGELLNEHCVSFPDREEAAAGERLPAADDVLAKWLALRADEHALVNEANMHLPGRQLDPDHVRRDIARLSEWTGGTPTAAEGNVDGVGGV